MYSSKPAHTHTCSRCHPPSPPHWPLCLTCHSLHMSPAFTALQCAALQRATYALQLKAGPDSTPHLSAGACRHSFPPAAWDSSLPSLPPCAAASSSCTQAGRRHSSASCSGVLPVPPPQRAAKSAPPRCSTSSVSVWPQRAARCAGVRRRAQAEGWLGSDGRDEQGSRGEGRARAVHESEGHVHVGKHERRGGGIVQASPYSIRHTHTN